MENEHPPPRTASPTRALGTLAILLFVTEAVTGLVLMFHYRPTLEHAYSDLVDLREVSNLGWIQGLHYWGGQLLLIVVWLHVLKVVAAGSYRGPRRLNWQIGVLLLVLTILLAFTGSVLPYDENAYWVAKSAVAPTGAVVANSPEAIDGALLHRYHAWHVGWLPLATIVLIGYHFWRARQDTARCERP